MAARGARAVRLGAVKLFVGPRDGILAVIRDVLHALVQLGAALLAEPREAIVLVSAALPLEDEDERLGREARRVRRARRAVHDLAFPHDGDLLFAAGRAGGGGPVAL